MKFQLSEDTFPKLALPRERAEAIAHEVEQLVARTLELSDSFADAGQQLDSHAWKLLKSKEKVRVFQSRRPPRSHRGDKAAVAAAFAGHDTSSAIGAHVRNDAGALNRYWADWSPTSSSSSSASSYSSGPSFQHSEGTAHTPSSSSTTSRSARHFMRKRMQKLLSSGSSSSSSSTLSSQSSAQHFTANSSNGGARHEQSGVEDPRAPGERVPMLVVTGQISGTVEDVALGWQADTLPRWLQRDAFLNDELDSCQLLGTLQEPTAQEPFRFLGIKWGVKSFGKFASPRDFIFVEATGMTSNAHGQSVCYHVRQSVELPGFRELLDCNLIRGYISTCITFRASDFDAVEFFGRGLIDARGDMRRSVGCSLYAERLLVVTDVVECALAQKLMRYAQQQQQSQQRRQRAGDRWTTSPKCENCHKSLNKFGTLVQSGGACHCCRRTFCSRCTVSKKIALPMGNETLLKTLPFCMHCILQARQIPASDVALGTTAIVSDVSKFSSTRSIGANEARVCARTRQLGKASQPQAVVNLVLLFFALSVASSPLFDGSIDAESMRDDDGLLVRKNTSYAKAHFMGPGFFDAFVDSMRSNATISQWFPQPGDSAFLGFPFLDQSEFSNGPCAILDAPTTSANAPECILMSAHEGDVSAYGLCRNGSEYVSIHYLLLLVTPTDIGGLLSSGTWVESMREIVMVGFKIPSECVNGNKPVFHPNLSDLREISGAFYRAASEHVNCWFDIMALSLPVRLRLFYLVGKQDNRQGLVLTSRKLQSFDNIIAQNAYGSTLADKFEVEALYPTSEFAYVTLYRVAGADITLPRLQFTFAVAAQALALLTFLLSIASRNSASNTYHFVHQILRLLTFVIIAVQLLYVLYYQIFNISYIGNNTETEPIYVKKVMYSACVGYILLHQLDVLAAVTLWPKMANNDAYYFTRIVWMLASLGMLLWSLTVRDAKHYVVWTSSSYALGASECNVTRLFLFQHYVCLGVFLAHSVTYGLIQVMQWRRNPLEHLPADVRTSSDQEVSFEHYACGGALTEYYYYNTLVAVVAEHPYKKHEYATCSKAVRDEGFVLLGGGCGLLVRAKDLYVVMLLKAMPRGLVRMSNLSIVVAFLFEDRVMAMHRMAYRSLWVACQRWDGRISYPNIG